MWRLRRLRLPAARHHWMRRRLITAHKSVGTGVVCMAGRPAIRCFASSQPIRGATELASSPAASGAGASAGTAVAAWQQVMIQYDSSAGSGSLSASYPDPSAAGAYALLSRILSSSHVRVLLHAHGTGSGAAAAAATGGVAHDLQLWRALITHYSIGIESHAVSALLSSLLLDASPAAAATTRTGGGPAAADSTAPSAPPPPLPLKEVANSESLIAIVTAFLQHTAVAAPHTPSHAATIHSAPALTALLSAADPFWSRLAEWIAAAEQRTPAAAAYNPYAAPHELSASRSADALRVPLHTAIVALYDTLRSVYSRADAGAAPPTTTPADPKAFLSLPVGLLNSFVRALTAVSAHATATAPGSGKARFAAATALSGVIDIQPATFVALLNRYERTLATAEGREKSLRSLRARTGGGNNRSDAERAAAAEARASLQSIHDLLSARPIGQPIEAISHALIRVFARRDDVQVVRRLLRQLQPKPPATDAVPEPAAPHPSLAVLSVSLPPPVLLSLLHMYARNQAWPLVGACFVLLHPSYAFAPNRYQAPAPTAPTVALRASTYTYLIRNLCRLPMGESTVAMRHRYAFGTYKHEPLTLPPLDVVLELTALLYVMRQQQIRVSLDACLAITDFCFRCMKHDRHSGGRVMAMHLIASVKQLIARVRITNKRDAVATASAPATTTAVPDINTNSTNAAAANLPADGTAAATTASAATVDPTTVDWFAEIASRTQSQPATRRPSDSASSAGRQLDDATAPGQLRSSYLDAVHRFDWYLDATLTPPSASVAEQWIANGIADESDPIERDSDIPIASTAAASAVDAAAVDDRYVFINRDLGRRLFDVLDYTYELLTTKAVAYGSTKINTQYMDVDPFFQYPAASAGAPIAAHVFPLTTFATVTPAEALPDKVVHPPKPAFVRSKPVATSPLSQPAATAAAKNQTGAAHMFVNKSSPEAAAQAAAAAAAFAAAEAAAAEARAAAVKAAKAKEPKAASEWAIRAGEFRSAAAAQIELRKLVGPYPDPTELLYFPPLRVFDKLWQVRVGYTPTGAAAGATNGSTESGAAPAGVVRWSQSFCPLTTTAAHVLESCIGRTAVRSGRYELWTAAPPFGRRLSLDAVLAAEHFAPPLHPLWIRTVPKDPAEASAAPLTIHA